MPRPDPIPPLRRSTVRRFWRIMRLMAVFSVVIAAIAVILVARGDSGMHLHMMIATALGAGLTVLLGTGLMTLVFLSSRSGHDEQVRSHDEENS
jgi:uncharacterized membrane protein